MSGSTQEACSSSAGHAIAIVASAGGVQTLSTFVSCLPVDLPAPIFIVQHLPPSQRSYLREILQRRTDLTVKWAGTGMRIAAGEVYIAPPGGHLRIEHDHVLRLLPKFEGERFRPSGDVLFHSTAKVFGPQAVGIVLTGCLFDGAKGAQAIREQGGRVFVQSPDSCEHSDMPLAAMCTGAVDLALPTRVLAATVAALTMVPGALGLVAVGDTYRQTLASQALAKRNYRWLVSEGNRFPEWLTPTSSEAGLRGRDSSSRRLR